MKFFKFCLFFSLAVCGCADAAPKQNIPELTCPLVLPAEKDFPASWVVLGKVPADKLPLREVDFIDANAAEEKARLQGVKEREYSRDSLDEWTEYADRSEAVADYSADHGDVAMMCTYSKLQEEMSNVDKNVILFIPLPAKKAVNCLMIRRDVNPRYELSCKVQ